MKISFSLFARLSSLIVFQSISIVQIAQTTVDFNQPDGTSLGTTITDGTFGANDVPGLTINFFTANSSGVANSTILEYADNPLSGGVVGDMLSGDPMFIIQESSGSEFSFEGIYLVEWTGGDYVINIEGFRDGSSTGSVNVTTAGDSEETVSTADLTPSIFQNVDEVRLTSVSNLPSIPEMYLYYDAFVFDAAVALPVEWLSFQAFETSNGIVHLEWLTATETNNDYFEIQRKLGLNTWETVKIMDAVGNSADIVSYTYDDTLKTSERVFYRLKQVDVDGSFEYSSIVEVFIRYIDKLIVYPNPTKDFLTLKNIPSDPFSLTLFDASGKKIWCQSYQSPQRIDVSTYSKGSYFLQYHSHGKSIMKQFIKY